MGLVAAFVASTNPDGSLKLTQSRVITAGSVASTLIHVSLSLTVGLMGMRATLKGAKSGRQAVHRREAHVGSDEQAVHAILAQAESRRKIRSTSRRFQTSNRWRTTSTGSGIVDSSNIISPVSRNRWEPRDMFDLAPGRQEGARVRAR
jgi:hypothetical protein